MDIGTRIQVVGNTCAGKSTLAEQLAARIDAAFVDLDALNWLPDWVALTDTDPDEFRRRLAEAIAGNRWVIAGSYSGFTRPSRERLQTVVWLDLPLPLILWRVVSRSWRRWRSQELLWGTNRESFWVHFALWRGSDSLIYWALKTHRRKRRRYTADMADPDWAHVRFIRLRSVREVDEFVAAVERHEPYPAASPE